MKLKFYGTRGSTPACEAGFQEFGGNTACVRLAFPDTQTIAILDAGTGIRTLGKDLLAITHHDPDHDDAFLRRMERHYQLHAKMACLCNKDEYYISFCTFTNPCIFTVHTPSNGLKGTVSGRNFR